MNGSFEDAFYQLDSNRDGVVTLADLERYARDNHLKDKFIQKWLNLFGDEKKVIYYDKFCETMGIVPALEQFEQKTYKIDMSEGTRAHISEIINEYRERDNGLSHDTVDAITRKFSDEFGDTWVMKVDPTKKDLDVDYADDGYLYYSPSNTEKPKILVYREMQDALAQPTAVIFKKDMSEETEESIRNNINQHILKNGELNEDNLDDLIDTIEHNHGDNWGIVFNPSAAELNVPYKEDGILYYSLDETEDPKILVWRKIDKPTAVIFKKDMSEETEESIRNNINQHILKNGELNEDNLDDLIDTIEHNHGDNWGIVFNPSAAELNVPYKEDGILYYSQDETEDPKILVWRKIDKATPKVYTVDMTEDTKLFIANTVNDYLAKDSSLADDTLSAINRKLEAMLGDKWRVRKNPSTTDLSVKYAPDGLLYYSPNDKETTRLLVYRESKELSNGICKEIIYESIMSNSVKEGVLNTVRKNYNPNTDKLPKVEKIIKELNDSYGPTWNILLNPSKNELKVDYDYDGKIYFSPDEMEKVKLIVWRKDKEKSRGKMCFCCF